MGKRTAPRIISGKLRGVRLKSPSGNITRPITDRVKENLFNIIGYDLEGTRFLDLFAGTGSVGIEASSRGAGFVHFIEKNQLPAGILKQNLQLIKDNGSYTFNKMDAFHFIDSYKEEPFDYIFVAPPQYKGLWKKTFEYLERNPNILKDDGLIIVQIDPIEFEEIENTCFIESDKRKYGSTLLLFYRKNLT